MQKMFASAQEAKRKDIERAFGILQSRFHILTTPCRLWDRHAMKTIIATCVILHNLIIDYELKNKKNQKSKLTCCRCIRRYKYSTRTGSHNPVGIAGTIYGYLRYRYHVAGGLCATVPKYDRMDRTPWSALDFTRFTLSEKVAVCINSQFFVTCVGYFE